MKVLDTELYKNGLISQNILYLWDKAYKIVGYNAETKEFDLFEVNRKVAV